MTTVVNRRNLTPEQIKESYSRPFNIRESGFMYIGRGNGGKTHLLNCSYPGRGWLGNPFIRKFRDETPIPREESIAMYRVAFAKSVNESAYFRHQIREACTDKKLVCYCAPLSCHGDVIAEFVNAGCPENWK